MTTDLSPVYQEHHKEHLGIEHQADVLSRAIQSTETYTAAAQFLINIKTARKKWADIIKPAVKSAYEAHQRIKAVEKSVDEPLERAEQIHLKPALAAWERKEEKRRQEEQDRINRELKKQEEDAILAQAEQLEKSGEKEMADAVIQAPVQAPEVVLPKTTEVAGISYRTTYSADVFSIRLLCQAVADGRIGEEVVLPNMTMLNGLARSMKESMNGQWKAYGVRVKSERTVSASGRERLAF